MSKVNNKWDGLTDWEKEKAHKELSRLFRLKIQKDRVNKKSIEERIKDIRRKWPRGVI